MPMCEINSHLLVPSITIEGTSPEVIRKQEAHTTGRMPVMRNRGVENALSDPFKRLCLCYVQSKTVIMLQAKGKLTARAK